MTLFFHGFDVPAGLSRRLRLCLGLFVAWVASLMLAPAALAQRGDEGSYRILSARYGTAESHVDVTARLKELARRDARFKLENQIFNVDPAHGQRKTLRIYARGRDGQVRTFEYAEYSWVDGSQFTGWGRGDWGRGGWHGGWDGRPGAGNGSGADPGMRLEILNASYGAPGRMVDVTRRVRELARDGWVDAVVNNELLGTDPAPHQRKTLRLIYSTGRGGTQQMDVAEYDRLRLP